MISNQTSSLVRSSKFRHLNGHEYPKSERHENINVGYGQKLSNTLKTNGSLYVLPYNSIGGSVLAYKRVDDYGRWDEKIQNYGMIKAHKGKLSDFDLSPFKDRNDLLTVSNSDHTIRLWKLNAESNYKILEDCDLELNDPSVTSSNMSIISKVVFHPYIEKSVVSVQGDYIYLWDLEKRKIQYSVMNGKVSTASLNNTSPIIVESLSWNDNGQCMICGTSDRFIRVYDLREMTSISSSSYSSTSSSSTSSSMSTTTTSPIFSVEAHASMKPFQTLYNHGTHYVTSVGFSKSGTRELALYDMRKDLKCLQRVPIDNGASVLTPFYDMDIKLLYVAGRGDVNIRFYELEGGTLHYLNDYKCSSASASMDWIPKWKLSVNDFELARFLRLTNDKTIETLSMRVSRKSNIEQYFQEDIFPDTWNGEPVFETWNDSIRTSSSFMSSSSSSSTMSSNSSSTTSMNFNSELFFRRTMSLKPEGKISIYDVPVSEGGKVRPLGVTSNNNNSSSGTNTSHSHNNNHSNGGDRSADYYHNIHSESPSSSTIPLDSTHSIKIPSLRSQLSNNGTSHTLDAPTLMSPTEITRKSLSLSIASSIAMNSALAAANRPWYSKLFSGLGYYLGMAMFLLFRFTLISIPVFIYRKTTGYQPPPLQQRFERQVPPLSHNTSYNNHRHRRGGTSLKNAATTTTTSHSSTTQSTILITPTSTTTNNNTMNESSTYSKVGMEIAREYGQMIMKEYIGPLTKEDIFPKRAHDRDPQLKQSHVLEIDVTDLKKGSTHVLIWIKGRKKARATWVPLHWSSLNHNDCFLLDTGKTVYIYNGQYSNKLCRAKALDMSQMIKYKERGGDCQVVIIDGGVYTSSSSSGNNNNSNNSTNTNNDSITPLLKKQMTQFWTLLGVTHESSSTTTTTPLSKSQPTLTLTPTEDTWMKLLCEHYPPVERAAHKNVFSKLKIAEKSKYICQDEISDDLYQQLNDLGQRLYKLNSEIFEEMPLFIEKNETQDAYIQRIAPHMLSVIKLNQVPHGEIESLKQLEECIEKGELNALEIIQPSHRVLHSDQCYIFESLFTNEVFFWSGKQSNLNIRKWGIAIAKKLAQYRAMHDNPFSLMNPAIQRARKRSMRRHLGGDHDTTNAPHSHDTTTMSPSSHTTTTTMSHTPPPPSLIYFMSTVTRVIEDGEHSIYKQKFSDYPGMLMIQTQHQEASRGNIAETKKQRKIPFEELLKQKYAELSGATNPNTTTGIWNSKIRMWRVSDFQKIPYAHIGHFFSGDAFILLYTYTKVEGGKPFHKLFFWQGRDIKKKDKGTSAYKTVEVNEMIDEGVVEQQVRVVQDKEPQVFMDLFMTTTTRCFNRMKHDHSIMMTAQHHLSVPYYMVHKGKYRESVLEAFEKAQKENSIIKSKMTPFTAISSSNTMTTSMTSTSTTTNTTSTNTNTTTTIDSTTSSNSTTPVSEFNNMDNDTTRFSSGSSAMKSESPLAQRGGGASSNNNNTPTTTTPTRFTSSSSTTTTPTTPSSEYSSSWDDDTNSSNTSSSNNSTPIKLFQNIKSTSLDDHEKKYSPQVLQFQKEMIRQIAMKSLYDSDTTTLHCYDVRNGKVCECDDLHPVFLNPFHAMIFCNYNFTVELNRKEMNASVSTITTTTMNEDIIIMNGTVEDVATTQYNNDDDIGSGGSGGSGGAGTIACKPQLIVYYGMYCPLDEKKFIENHVLKELFSTFRQDEILFIQDHDVNNTIEQLSKHVFKSIIDPYFEPFLLRFKNYLLQPKRITSPAISTLYSINDHSGEFTMTPIQHYGESDLSSTQAYILDTLDLEEKVYVWIGKLCNIETKKFALTSALEYYHTWKCQQQKDSFYTKKNTTTTSEDDFDPASFVKKEDEMNLRVVTELEEPPEFTRHFLAWSTSSTAFKIRYKQSKDPNVISKGFVKTPRTPRRSTHTHQMVKSSALDQDHSSGVYEIEHCPTCTSLYNKLFSHQTYSYKVLTSGSLPEGIDKSKLETYLSNDEFIKVFGMDKKKFSQLQPWKQTSLKKEKSLF
ncbi:hypothetical protein C9374_014018 [Naegleria lovaniensis]|uniref:HP domain-containing protein n=1 Tax=Naegleria lovaniensis TaxID=51637 RepID=A0AA88H1V2_NAELO|nr:uncharacterized protein C9374_014018 [Naegleria lovaniensis]KAG2389458.1 hypothetical protein C9374_014018 [Naegleria lovaniensis]